MSALFTLNFLPVLRETQKTVKVTTCGLKKSHLSCCSKPVWVPGDHSHPDQWSRSRRSCQAACRPRRTTRKWLEEAEGGQKPVISSRISPRWVAWLSFHYCFHVCDICFFSYTFTLIDPDYGTASTQYSLSNQNNRSLTCWTLHWQIYIRELTVIFWSLERHEVLHMKVSESSHQNWLFITLTLDSLQYQHWQISQWFGSCAIISSRFF